MGGYIFLVCSYLIIQFSSSSDKKKVCCEGNCQFKKGVHMHDTMTYRSSNIFSNRLIVIATIVVVVAVLLVI